MAGPKRSIIWAPEAEADLANVWNYYLDVAGSKVAGDKVRAIGEVCRMLEEHPLAGRALDELGLRLRSALASPYVLFYRVDGDAIQLVRILDGRRDIEDIFADDL